MTDKPSKTLGIPWKPGQSGNPGGRPKAIKEVIELAREHTVTAITTLARIAADIEAPPAAQVAASQALLDRGWGKPVQAMEHSGPGGEPLTGIVVTFVKAGEAAAPDGPIT